MAAHFNIEQIDASPVHRKYVVSFFGDQILTTITADSDIVTQWFNEMERPSLLLVGVGVHFRCFNEFVAATLELCVGGRCLLYQVDCVTTEHPDALLDFLRNEEYTFVGWKISRHLNRLYEDQALDIPRKISVELRKLTAKRCADLGRDAELSALAEMVLGKELEDMPVDNLIPLRWDLDVLLASQVKHACAEAFVSFEIGRVLNAREYRLTPRDDQGYPDYSDPSASSDEDSSDSS
ncbi:hypothetical protein CDL12_27245 [Handroanthus impetiginosus]|uniref:3'-5' exonuclease domain-containing protein n=1 Tax=Handroanthus impetiginosus TaxID=429701 RepID=A0A2G9G538_9LAMI|nr:hypothetical protein CDL12_27245 [Handroanthus impetiginosus]